MGGVEPARTFVLSALNAGKSVVTSNKELFCKHSHELGKDCQKEQLRPVLRGDVRGRRARDTHSAGQSAGQQDTFHNGHNQRHHQLHPHQDDRRRRILRGKYSKRRSAWAIAEANPTADVEGFDAAYNSPYFPASPSIPRYPFPGSTARGSRTSPPKISSTASSWATCSNCWR